MKVLEVKVEAYRVDYDVEPNWKSNICLLLGHKYVEWNGHKRCTRCRLSWIRINASEFKELITRRTI